MTKEEVLKLIREYQQYPKQMDYEGYEDEINAEEVAVHEAIAESLRQELEKNPDFFKNLTPVDARLKIERKIREKKEQQK